MVGWVGQQHSSIHLGSSIQLGGWISTTVCMGGSTPLYVRVGRWMSITVCNVGGNLLSTLAFPSLFMYSKFKSAYNLKTTRLDSVY